MNTTAPERAMLQQASEQVPPSPPAEVLHADD
jgi:hypothetical protein